MCQTTKIYGEEGREQERKKKLQGGKVKGKVKSGAEGYWYGEKL